jgi:hypothetical protein
VHIRVQPHQTGVSAKRKNGGEEGGGGILPQTVPRGKKHYYTTATIVYRRDAKHFWLSPHNCQSPTPTSQNKEFKEQIRVLEAD